MEEKRACLSASRLTRLKRMRAKSTQNTSTLPPARSKSSRWGQWQEALVYCRTIIHDHHPNDPPHPTPPHDLLQPKGADRKQKTDREKMEKRAPQEKEKYQPSYETTILTEVSSSVMCSASGSTCRHWSQSAAADDQLKDICKCKSCPSNSPNQRYLLCIDFKKAKEITHIDYWVSDKVMTHEQTADKWKLSCSSPLAEMCHNVTRCCVAVLPLAWGHIRQQLPISRLQQHTQQLPGGRRVSRLMTLFSVSAFLLCSDTVCFHPFFRNGSPNHQPEPVVQVADVSSNVFTPAGFTTSGLTAPLHINIHKCRADIWVMNLSVDARPTLSAAALCEHENKQK